MRANPQQDIGVDVKGVQKGRKLFPLNNPDLGPIKIPLARSRAELMRDLAHYGSASATGDGGAINVWRKPGGEYVCEYYVFRATEDALVTSRLGTVRTWLRDVWPRLRR